MPDDLVEMIGVTLDTPEGDLSVLLLKSYSLVCFCCGSDEYVQEHMGQLFCKKCREHFKRLGKGQ
jgi:Zn finger protein HypA/HybF involved in hydrogenase expression